MKLIIKQLIKEKGYTMQQFADKLGIARVNLTKTINGNPTKDTLNKIAALLGVHVTELFEPTNTVFIICPSCKKRMKFCCQE